MARAQGVGARGSSQVESWTTIRSPVYWSLLGLVIERPGYGYELLKRFEREFDDALPLSSDSHIYRALNVLESSLLIERMPVGEGDGHGPDRQPKPHYRATEEGVRRYRDWLMGEVGAGRRQSWLFVRRLAVFAQTPEVALEIIDHFERVCLAPESRRGIVGDEETSGHGLAERLASEESRLSADATLPWAEYARGQFEALAREHRERANGDGPA
jgi:DNA-binding PadR family transcriptional regulator